MIALLPSISVRCLAALALLALNLRVDATPQFNRRQTSSATASSPSSGILTLTVLSVGPGSVSGPIISLKDLGPLQDFNYTTCDSLLQSVEAHGGPDGYTLKEFFTFNPEIEPNCINLVPNYDYCLISDTPKGITDPLASSPGPTGTRTNPNCSEYVQVGEESCNILGAFFKFNDKQFAFLNFNKSCDSVHNNDTICVRPIAADIYPPDTSAFTYENSNATSSATTTSSLDLTSNPYISAAAATSSTRLGSAVSDNGVSSVPAPTTSTNPSSAAAGTSSTSATAGPISERSSLLFRR
ncbi:hypothetical protein DFH07DRAFT_1065792, partial [Mycena maculata]